MTQPVLLVIDIQQAAFDGVRCPPMDHPERLLSAAHTLIAAARAGGAPVVYVQHGEGAGAPFETGTPHWQLHASFDVRDGDAVVHKQQSSAFEGTDLQQRLQQLGANELVVCGLQSEFCVSNTTKSALGLGYTVRLAQDGHGTWASEGKAADTISAEVNEELRARGATLAPTAELADWLRRPR
jgi:nicotinamidase-related amidase